MTGTPEPVGTVEVALAHTARLMEQDPALAATQAREILQQLPEHPIARLLLGGSLRRNGELDAAIAVLEPLVQEQPLAAAAHYEYALALGRVGRGDEAVAQIRRTLELKPDLADAWLALADHLRAIGETHAADEAYARHIKTAARDPRLLAPATALCDGRIAVAESQLREHLRDYPTDIAAIRMLAEVAARLGRDSDAIALLERCLELAPGFTAARNNYATLLNRQNRSTEALQQIERVLADEPQNPGARFLKAAALTRIGEYEAAITAYEDVLREYPQQAKAWMSYGHTLKTTGRTDESIRAYRRSIELMPELGESYWSLANLKTFRFAAKELEAMSRQLARSDLDGEHRFHFHFAVGKAMEDADEFEASFRHYAEGNRLRRGMLKYRAEDTSAQLKRIEKTLTREFFAARTGMGHEAPDPIFIVGMPRAGSTLLEQILASHSQVEGTMELPNIIAMARELGGRQSRQDENRYPEILAELGADELRALGERYVAETRVQRKTDARYFIDKMPNNFQHVGLIHLILPNARIIDARRHPLGCCFSGFKQHFARGQNYSYSLADIGQFYRAYVELMRHYDAVLPGRVHRVIYERMVDDTEQEIRRLLDYCGLPFEDACLRFYETERAVRTPSSEQVRQPIFRAGVEQWRKYDNWLEPLKIALGPVLDAYPGVPPF
ncbi:MAG: sulfotransferase [Steroidobacteraceae bacterium]